MELVVAIAAAAAAPAGFDLVKPHNTALRLWSRTDTYFHAKEVVAGFGGEQFINGDEAVSKDAAVRNS